MPLEEELDNRSLPTPRSDRPSPYAGTPRVPQAPLSIPQLIGEVAGRYGLPAWLLSAVAKQESGHQHIDPKTGRPKKSAKGALGIMQLMEDTARRFGVDRHDLKENLEGGARYLRWLLQRYEGDVAKAVAAYNAGEGRIDRVLAGVSHLPSETVGFLKAIVPKADLAWAGVLPVTRTPPRPFSAPDQSPPKPEPVALNQPPSVPGQELGPAPRLPAFMSASTATPVLKTAAVDPEHMLPSPVGSGAEWPPADIRGFSAPPPPPVHVAGAIRSAPPARSALLNPPTGVMPAVMPPDIKAPAASPVPASIPSPVPAPASAQEPARPAPTGPPKPSIPGNMFSPAAIGTAIPVQARNGSWYLAPTVTEDGQQLTPDQARDHFYSKAKHYGAFASPQEAEVYRDTAAQEIREREEAIGKTYPTVAELQSAAPKTGPLLRPPAPDLQQPQAPSRPAPAPQPVEPMKGVVRGPETEAPAPIKGTVPQAQPYNLDFSSRQAEAPQPLPQFPEPIQGVTRSPEPDPVPAMAGTIPQRPSGLDFTVPEPRRATPSFPPYTPPESATPREVPRAMRMVIEENIRAPRPQIPYSPTPEPEAATPVEPIQGVMRSPEPEPGAPAPDPRRPTPYFPPPVDPIKGVVQSPGQEAPAREKPWQAPPLKFPETRPASPPKTPAPADAAPLPSKSKPPAPPKTEIPTISGGFPQAAPRPSTPDPFAPSRPFAAQEEASRQHGTQALTPQKTGLPTSMTSTHDPKMELLTAGPNAPAPPRDRQSGEPKATAQPSTQARAKMRSDVESTLRQAQLPNEIAAQAWDAYYGNREQRAFAEAMNKIQGLPDDVKRKLSVLRFPEIADKVRQLEQGNPQGQPQQHAEAPDRTPQTPASQPGAVPQLFPNRPPGSEQRPGNLPSLPSEYRPSASSFWNTITTPLTEQLFDVNFSRKTAERNRAIELAMPSWLRPATSFQHGIEEAAVGAAEQLTAPLSILLAPMGVLSKGVGALPNAVRLTHRGLGILGGAAAAGSAADHIYSFFKTGDPGEVGKAAVEIPLSFLGLRAGFGRAPQARPKPTPQEPPTIDPRGMRGPRPPREPEISSVSQAGSPPDFSQPAPRVGDFDPNTPPALEVGTGIRGRLGAPPPVVTPPPVRDLTVPPRTSATPPGTIQLPDPRTIDFHAPERPLSGSSGRVPPSRQLPAHDATGVFTPGLTMAQNLEEARWMPREILEHNIEQMRVAAAQHAAEMLKAAGQDQEKLTGVKAFIDEAKGRLDRFQAVYDELWKEKPGAGTPTPESIGKKLVPGVRRAAMDAQARGRTGPKPSAVVAGLKKAEDETSTPSPRRGAVVRMPQPKSDQKGVVDLIVAGGRDNPHAKGAHKALLAGDKKAAAQTLVNGGWSEAEAKAIVTDAATRVKPTGSQSPSAQSGRGVAGNYHQTILENARKQQAATSNVGQGSNPPRPQPQPQPQPSAASGTIAERLENQLKAAKDKGLKSLKLTIDRGAGKNPLVIGINADIDTGADLAQQIVKAGGANGMARMSSNDPERPLEWKFLIGESPSPPNPK